MKKPKKRTNKPKRRRLPNKTSKIYKSNRKKTGRNFDDPRYKKFRKEVRKRDRATCQLCSSKTYVQVHHILKYSEFIHLRFDPINGICLCRRCHTMVNRFEHIYVKTFMEIVQRNLKRQKEEEGGE